MDPAQELYVVADAARILGLTKAALRRKLERGQVRSRSSATAP